MTPQEAVEALRAALPAEYTVDRILDAGGQGTVFVGTFAGEPAALKLFDPRTDRRRVQRELDLLDKHTCPTLVAMRAHTPVVFAGLDGTVVAYEFHPGGNLRQHLEPAAPPLAPAEIIRIGVDVSCAVETLWSNRIVHRDIKPANIVRAADGRYVLVDVGLARHVDLSDITALGGAPGTFGYKSPEQAAGRRNLTLHSDVFSLGVRLFELAAKGHPYDRDQHRIGACLPHDLAQLRPDLPAPLVRLLNQMLAVPPASRPSNVSARLRGI